MGKGKTYMFPPSNLICAVTTASPIQTIAKTPLNTKLFCSGLALKLSSKLSKRQKTSGPQRSQSRSPGLIFPWFSKFSVSITLPAIFLTSSLAPANPPLLKPSNAPRIVVVLSIMLPPKRYLGYNTSRILDQTANRSRDRVSQTDSSIVFRVARSVPGMAEVRYCSLSGREEEPMLPVSGAWLL